MILTCPSCGTQYSVKDGAIPAEGRRVRCAACGESWHQPGEAVAEPDDAPEPDREPDPALYRSDDDEALSESVSEEPVSGPEPDWGYQGDEAEAVGEVPIEPIAPGAPLVEPPNAIPVPSDEAETWAMSDSDEDPAELAKEIPDAEEIAAAEEETPPRARRNWWMGIAIGLAVVALIALALWFVAPDSLRRSLGMASAAPMPLQIAAGNPERQKLASGNELVVVSGKIVNPSATEQTVPPIEAQLHDKSGKLVYSWTIAPPARSLPPGGSASFNSAEVDVPASGPDSTITFSLKN